MKISLIPLSAKPFHKGHMQLIEHAQKNSDKCFLFVSINNRSRKNELTIDGNKMHHIWQNIIEKHLNKDKCDIIYTHDSPVKLVYDFINNNNNNNNININIYTGEDDQKRYSDLINKYNINIISFKRGTDTTYISGTQMRLYLKNNNKQDFINMLPDSFNLNDKNYIYENLKYINYNLTIF